MEVALRGTGYFLALQGRAALLPLTLLRAWLCASANLLVSLFALVGLQPREYANRMKISELNRHVDVMHQREAVLLKRLEEVSAELELQSRDKSRAIRKMHRARSDVHSLEASLDHLQSAAAAASAGTAGVASAGSGRRAPRVDPSHALLAGAVLGTYLCGGTMTKLEFKLLLTALVPAVLIFFMPGAMPVGSWRAISTQCISAGVLGFTMNHLVC